ncbi:MULTISPECIES: hypothetical protein [unclassified Microcoleus]|uniref:hypothetical protein n=1 Tax=unclassified Microcoleus TaxID=2642155 RepID=UPI002FCE748D
MRPAISPYTLGIRLARAAKTGLFTCNHQRWRARQRWWLLPGESEGFEYFFVSVFV